ncbi:hypothetical protein BS47DRAFT_1352384 [Hydnum rufescens UP504]|uniref:Uncharacterized protein n=1 Tax=Hydnum rufescens UP504 TaxID=1448309 RepID=A0A9P6DQ12_9AGAM|nr:hypothetical protein BS47DRAFT_1352384 [Hydnum rufescens UP504]
MVACTNHPASDGTARWPCGHQSCVECANKLITWSTVCPECRKPHNGAYTIDLTEDSVPYLPKNVPVAPSSSTATAAKSRPRGKSTTTPKQPKKAAAKPRGKSANSLSAQLLELESEVERLRAQNAALLAQQPELDSMRMRVSAADHLRAALEARVASLIQETADLRRERDVALAEKEGSEKRFMEIEDDRLGKEVLWIRQIKGEEQKGKRIQGQLESAENRVNRLQEILTHHKNKETEHKDTIRKLKFENIRLQRSSCHTASSPPPSSPTVRHFSSMPSSSPMSDRPPSHLSRRSRMLPPPSSSPVPSSSPLPSSSPPPFAQDEDPEIVKSTHPPKRRKTQPVFPSDPKSDGDHDNGRLEALKSTQPSKELPSSDCTLDRSMFLPSSIPSNDQPPKKKPKADGTLGGWITNSPNLHIGPRRSRKV